MQIDRSNSMSIKRLRNIRYDQSIQPSTSRTAQLFATASSTGPVPISISHVSQPSLARASNLVINNFSNAGSPSMVNQGCGNSFPFPPSVDCHESKRNDHCHEASDGGGKEMEKSCQSFENHGALSAHGFQKGGCDLRSPHEKMTSRTRGGFKIVRPSASARTMARGQARTSLSSGHFPKL